MYAFQLDGVGCQTAPDGTIQFSTGVYINTVGVVAVDVNIPEGSTGAQVSDAIRAAIVLRATEYGITLSPSSVITNAYTTG